MALPLHLHPNYFILGNESAAHQYTGPLKGLIDAVVKGQLPPEFVELLENCGAKFDNGSVAVDVYDYRSNPQGLRSVLASEFSQRVILRPSARVMWADIASMHEKYRRGTPCFEDDMLDLEARLMTGTQPLVVLDPSPAVAMLDNVFNYNRNMGAFQSKRPRDWGKKQEEAASAAESHRLMLMRDTKRREFHPTFRQHAFRGEWRKKKLIADTEPLLGFDAKRIAKRRSPLIYNNIGKVVRTVRFVTNYSTMGSSQYTILNVYERHMNNQPGSEANYEAVLRWGSQKDTAINGVTFRFALGGPALWEQFVQVFIVGIAFVLCWFILN
ncbi:hypothetical protein M427DRAFT_196120 [Gonapodya prolifera JEL478]|uniref:Spt20-like SEP domain-containing protein n=1 Tax=Gonapodya prolifera (strain JEL478) TaxID=1344416 RepID=A0A139APE6_GONPJ|nr:hypothetical protein M427DRAFT_196120 [Gonapodya prolifera JEL478]|eukprot:KXS18627.1 hypothetical protein M427DRAFT_196120 [Gonapodya prolifera JEL478]